MNDVLNALDSCFSCSDDHEIILGLEQIDHGLSRFDSLVGDARPLGPAAGRVFGILCTILAEFPPYVLETSGAARVGATPRENLIEAFHQRSKIAARVLTALLSRPELYLGQEIGPLRALVSSILEQRRFMPFRVIQVGKIADRLNNLSLSANGEPARILQLMQSFKYARFGTSGWRARWGIDFDELTAKCVAQAICDFISGTAVPDHVAEAVPGATGRANRTLVIGYDSRAHARRVAEMVAHVAMTNGIGVSFASRDTPTPALIYWAIEVIGQGNVAGIVNCTASHNPTEWQGIKFSPHMGVPAPTAITDFLAARANQLKLRGTSFSKTPRGFASRLPSRQTFDPQESYCDWLLSTEREGIPIDPSAIRDHFNGKTVVIDEMHGAGRGYLRKLLRRIGVKFTTIHGSKSQRALQELGYASPEWPYIEPLADEVKRSGSAIGVGLDTDADRFGVIDSAGRYVKPNQLLPMLTKYLLDRGLTGKILRTVSGSRLIDRIAGEGNLPREFRPGATVTPAYVEHPFYLKVKGTGDVFRGAPVFLQPVGIKYVVEGMLLDSEYRISYSPGFRRTLLLGGEESSGLTSQGHVPDKDGIWGNLLVLSMLADRRAEIETIWRDLCSSYGTAWFERLDTDAGDLAKERLVNYFLEADTLETFSGFTVDYIGGVKYDVVEVQLRSHDPEASLWLEIRASGTEPLTRVYVEAIMTPQASESTARELVDRVHSEVQGLLLRFSVEEIRESQSPSDLAAILAATPPLRDEVREEVTALLSANPILRHEAPTWLSRLLPHLELRNRDTAKAWLNLLKE